MSPASVVQHAGRPRARRALLAFLAASIAVHGAVIVGFPEISLHWVPPKVTVLEVVLVQSAPPRPMPVADVRPIPPPQSTPPVRRKVPKQRPILKPAPKLPQVEPTAPVLKLPPPATELIEPAERSDSSTLTETAPPTRVAVATRTLPSFGASYLQNPAPRYPLAARRAGEQGTVRLKVLVTRKGLPQRVEVEKTSGSSRLDAAALDAVRRWRFVAARRGATPIASWVVVPVVFRLEDPT